MMLPRRRFLRLGLAAATGAAIVPSLRGGRRRRPIRRGRCASSSALPPAGAADITARLMAQWLSERLGQPFIVENRPGAGTNIATEAVVQAPPDGYTLLLSARPHAINATLYEKLNFNFIRDIAPVASAITHAVRAWWSIHRCRPRRSPSSSPMPRPIRARSTWRRAASAGPHLSGELFKMMAGVDLVHVPYRGEAPAITDLLGGQVQVMFGTTAVSIEYIKAANCARSRSPPRCARGAAGHSDVGEFLPGYEVERLDRLRRAAGHAARGDRGAQQADQRGARRSANGGAVCRSRRRGACGLARRFRQADRRRDREVGQGDPRGAHQGGVRRAGQA